MTFAIDHDLHHKSDLDLCKLPLTDQDLDKDCDL